MLHLIHVVDVLHPTFIVFLHQGSFLSRGVTHYFEPYFEGLLLDEALEYKHLLVLGTPPKNVVLQGNLVMRAIEYISVESYLVVWSALQPLLYLYGQSVKLQLVLCQEMDAALFLPIDQRVDGHLVVINLFLHGEGEEGRFELRTNIDPALCPAYGGK